MGFRSLLYSGWSHWGTASQVRVSQLGAGHGCCQAPDPGFPSDTSFNGDCVVGLLPDSMEIAILFTLENCFQTSVSF